MLCALAGFPPNGAPRCSRLGTVSAQHCVCVCVCVCVCDFNLCVTTLGAPGDPSHAPLNSPNISQWEEMTSR